MTGRPPAPSVGAPTGGRPPIRRRFLPRLRDARIRSKLGLILLIPLIAVLALAGSRLADSVDRAVTSELVRSLTVVSAEAADVSHQLHRERVTAAQLLSDPDGDAAAFGSQADRTDAAVERYRAARDELGEVPELVEARLTPIDGHLRSLEGVRQLVLGEAPVPAQSVVLRYGVILSDILDYQDMVGQISDDPVLSEQIRATSALARAKTHSAEVEALAWAAVGDGSFLNVQATDFLAEMTGQQEALVAFALSATPEQQEIVNSLVTGSPALYLEQVASDLAQADTDLADVAPDRVALTFLSMVELMRQAELGIHADLVDTATALRDDVFQQVLIESVLVLLALIIALTSAVLLARMLAKSLGRLRQHALAVADRELPETVQRLSDPRTLGENTPAALAAQVREPSALRSRDEIGQVAQAFTVVHRAAVRVAAEQAALRTSVSAMFLNLARRSQSLVDRMISQLDEIERHEEDPKRLARMFTLDHLATRMRRNDENLLTLAGADSSPPRSDDALVADVLRAAQSEVEHYDRIEFGTVDTDVSVIAGGVNDVVRLIAELFDNATRFSPPDAPVVCEARRLGDQVIVQIEDRGVGMSQDQVDRVNAWLATPPAVEVTTFRKMGLAVVARLASRHGIRVELRCDPNLGTVAYVALPRAVLLLPPSRLRFAEIPSPRSPLAPELPPAAPPPPAAPTAPLPARHLGQLPRRSPAVVHHAANRRGQNSRDANARANHVEPSTNQVEQPVAGRPVYELPAATSAMPAAAAGPAAPAPAVPEATMELPIFREMEAVWFRRHGSVDMGDAPQTPRAGGYPVPPEPGDAGPAAGAGYDPGGYANGDNRYATDQYQADQYRADQYQADQQPADQYAADRYPSGRYATDQRSAEQRVPEHPTTELRATDPHPTAEWQTAADTGWQAAAAAAQPQDGGATQSGLPKRVPQAQLVPGSVSVPTSGPNQRRSPEEVRGLLAAYHRGVQRGRESGGGR